ncbi:MAG: hypothetical protein AABO41_05805 [Acidobacteriota bacterium]
MSISQILTALYVIGALSLLYFMLLGLAWLIGQRDEKQSIQNLFVQHLDIVRDALLLTAIAVVLLMVLDKTTFTFAIQQGSVLLVGFGGTFFLLYLLVACYVTVLHIYHGLTSHDKSFFAEQAEKMKGYTKALRIWNAVISAMNCFLILTHVIVDKMDNIHHS